EPEPEPEISDADGDGVADEADNCPTIANPDQANSDTDSLGNACDADDDNDGISDLDEQQNYTNPLRADSDGDGVNDAEDQFPIDASKVLTLKDAHRLLLQTTFGPTKSDQDEVQRIGVERWLDQQFNAPSAYDDPDDNHQTHLQRTIEIAQAAEPSINWYETAVFNSPIADFSVDEYQMAAWWENAIGLHPQNTEHGTDQLRQRMAYALSQILVVSAFEPPLFRRGEALAHYYDILARHAFGNYRDLLGEIARNPAMGVYLSHQGNRKTDLSKGVTPDENFARELMQLFTLGLYELNLDGSANRDGNPNTYPDAGEALIPTYTETDITELSKVMTGWDLVGNERFGINYPSQGDYTQAMEFTASEHEDEVAIGGDGSVSLLGQSFALDAGDDGSGMDAALDVLFNHPNVAPHISKHLIMRFVTSNPSGDYIARVAAVFANNGSNVRGDLKAVLRAVLTDEEARNSDLIGPDSGKIKEPLIAVSQLLRVLGAVPMNGWLSQDDVTRMSGVYWYKAPQEDLGQAALRSPSVFNFYSPDYTPSNSYFTQNGLVSPEMKLLTDQNLLEFSNLVFLATYSFEKYRIEAVESQTLQQYAADKSHGYKFIMQTSLEELIALMTSAAGGDLDNLEPSWEPSRPYKTAAVNVAIDYFDERLLGGEMPAEVRAAMFEYLMDSADTNHGSAIREAQMMAKDTVRMIATSSIYMVQK
ncbi:DUF1800 family protein, partial [Leucothrix pacifica]